MRLELKIVDLLARNKEIGFTINEIAKRLNQHYSFVHKIIGRLEEDNVITKKRIGRADICSLDSNSERGKVLLSLAEIERKEEFYTQNKELRLILEDLIKVINTKLKDNILTLVLFGSYAKHTAVKTSDVDILLVVKRKFPTSKILREVYAKYGREVNAVMLTLNELKQQKEREFVKEIIKDHYVLYRAENFVSMVLK